MHCVQKDKKSCELKAVESTDLSQRQIHGEVCTEVCKVAVGAFVLALVGMRISFTSQVLAVNGRLFPAILTVRQLLRWTWVLRSSWTNRNNQYDTVCWYFVEGRMLVGIPSRVVRSSIRDMR